MRLLREGKVLEQQLIHNNKKQLEKKESEKLLKFQTEREIIEKQNVEFQIGNLETIPEKEKNKEKEYFYQILLKLTNNNNEDSFVNGKLSLFNDRYQVSHVVNGLETNINKWQYGKFHHLRDLFEKLWTQHGGETVIDKQPTVLNKNFPNSSSEEFTGDDSSEDSGEFEEEEFSD